MSRDFVIHQYCLDKKALVRRDKECLNICSNPKCKSCGMFRESFEKMAEEFVDLVENIPEYLSKKEIKILKKTKIKK